MVITNLTLPSERYREFITLTDLIEAWRPFVDE